MDVDGFWAIIGGAREDEDALRAALEPLSREDLADFDGLLYAFWSRANRQDVWGAGYTLDGGMSDDSFMDFRSWLISQGRAVYEAVLINPDALAHVPDLVVGDDHTAEAYGSAASEIYEARYGEEPPPAPGHYRRAVAASLPPAERARREHPIADEDWEGDEQRRYPRLLALIAEQQPSEAGTLVELWGNTENPGPAEFAHGLHNADWPDGVQTSGQAWISDDPRVGGVRVRVGAPFGGHEIGDLRAEYDGHQVWIGWAQGRHWTHIGRPLGATGVPAVTELDSAEAVRFAFDTILTQLRREVAHLIWLDDAGVTIHHCCMHVDDGTGGWWSDFEHQPLPPRRPPDRVIRYRPVA